MVAMCLPVRHTKSGILDHGQRLKKQKAIVSMNKSNPIINDGEIITDTALLTDGVWLYRDEVDEWWRLTFVEGEKASGPWIVTKLRLAGCKGQWRKPNPIEQRICENDNGWLRIVVADHLLPCPFCGGVFGHADTNSGSRNLYLAHEHDCWIGRSLLKFQSVIDLHDFDSMRRWNSRDTHAQ